MLAPSDGWDGRGRARLTLSLGLLGALSGLAGCYASHGADAGPFDAPTRDARVPDAPLRDAPVRDAPRDVPSPRDTGPRRDVPRGPTCARDADCMGSLCVLDLATGPVDGAPVPLACGAAGDLSPGVECESNLDCENGLCALLGGCVEPCVADGDCRMGEHCADVPIVTDRAALQNARACVRWVDAPSNVEVTASEDLRVGPFTSETFSVPRATGTRRLVLHVADRFDETRSIDRLALSGAGGTTLYDIGTAGFSPQINPAVGYFDLSAILIRNAPWPRSLDTRAALTYAITIGAESTHHRIVMEHEGTGEVLDFNVVFVGVAPTATNRRVLSEMLAGYGDILATVGARVGRVRQFEVVGAAASRFAVIDDQAEVGELFRMSAGAARPAINLFLISSSSVFLGIAGGIPGSMAVHGTRASGVALSFDDLASAVMSGFPIEFLSVVLAHEVGHFIGLFHTTEADGTSLEPLPDTGVCDLSRDANGDGMLTFDECSGLGGDNIMFWGVSDPSSTFSPTQRDVVGSAPVLLP